MARCGCPSSCAAFVIAQSMLEAARRAGSPVVERSRPPTERAGAPTYRPRLLPGTAGWQTCGHLMPVRRRISPVPPQTLITCRPP